MSISLWSGFFLPNYNAHLPPVYRGASYKARPGRRVGSSARGTLPGLPGMHAIAFMTRLPLVLKLPSKTKGQRGWISGIVIRIRSLTASRWSRAGGVSNPFFQQYFRRLRNLFQFYPELVDDVLPYVGDGFLDRIREHEKPEVVLVDRLLYDH